MLLNPLSPTLYNRAGNNTVRIILSSLDSIIFLGGEGWEWEGN